MMSSSLLGASTKRDQAGKGQAGFLTPQPQLQTTIGMGLTDTPTDPQVKTSTRNFSTWTTLTIILNTTNRLKNYITPTYCLYGSAKKYYTNQKKHEFRKLALKAYLATKFEQIHSNGLFVDGNFLAFFLLVN